MATYERVTYTPEGADRARTVILRDPVEVPFATAGPVLTGREAARDGSPTNRRHIIGTALIGRRVPLVLNRHYGELEEAPA